MLVLSRRIDETLIIGDDIVVTVVDIKGSQVRLGITAPSDVTIFRQEVADRIRQEIQNADSDGADPETPPG